ncbi:hypothetical protein [Arthrobacter sp. efr-133-R2A-120]|uniref:hypothetical protein n=1 Tax=Arthrobacter sp. efr-133-R2A-120 TaxID=3040277 RepID=UPI00254FF6C6|nr:hypothetical protein [Arthrobacter sp. efr-133-R2A-120]
MNRQDTTAFLLQIERDAFALLTQDLHGEDTRAMIGKFITEQPPEVRATYVATLIHELATGFASALELLHGSREQALKVTQATALRFESVAPDLRPEDI